MSFTYYEDPILGKGRAQVDTGSGGSGGSSYVGGDRINIAGGTISFVNSADIVNVTGTSVTLQPNTAYKIYATSQAITLNANPPAAGKWAYEGHIELFVAGTGYVVTGSNVVLANALEPDAVNNCTVRFHDGIAIISVEDHVAGYIVVNGSTSGEGSLYYGITTSTNDYIAFDASLNGQTIPLAGAVAEGEKHVVGNGYEQTTLTGAVDCGTSKFTVANLALSNVGIKGGTMTLGDVFIPSGATVAVSGGQIAYERATIDGVCYNSGRVDLNGATINGSGTIDFGGSGGFLALTGTNTINGTTIQHGSRTDGGGMRVASDAVLYASGATFSGNETNTQGGAINVYAGGVAYLTDCVFDSNTASTYANAINVIGILNMYGCEFGNTQDVFVASAGNVNITGGATKPYTIGGTGKLTVSSGAILDLTGNTNATPIAPGGGITFEAGGATILYGSSGAISSSYIGGATCVSIDNQGRPYFNIGTVVGSNKTWTFRNTTINGSAGYLLYANSGSVIVMENTIMNGAIGSFLGATKAGTVNISGTLRLFEISGMVSVNIAAGTTITVFGSSSSISADAIVVEDGDLVTVAGSTIAPGTYTKINADGSTVPPQA